MDHSCLQTRVKQVEPVASKQKREIEIKEHLSVRSLCKRVHGLGRGTCLFVEVHFIPAFNHQILLFPEICSFEFKVKSEKIQLEYFPSKGYAKLHGNLLEWCRCRSLISNVYSAFFILVRKAWLKNSNGSYSTFQSPKLVNSNNICHISGSRP